MNTTAKALAATAACYARARQSVPGAGGWVVLHLDDEAAAWAAGSGEAPGQLACLPLGLDVLARRYFPAGRLNPLAVEDAIAEVEEVVMPLHRRLAPPAVLLSDSSALVELAAWAGMPAAVASWTMSLEAVERLFNRWVYLVEGRPASQDPLPTDGRFSSALLVLREWMHHLAFSSITVFPSR